MTATTIMSGLDRTWSDDRTRTHVETHAADFAVDADAAGIVVVRGELDTATAPLLRAMLDTVYARRLWRVKVDLSAVTFFDAQALTTLVAARRHRVLEITRKIPPALAG